VSEEMVYVHRYICVCEVCEWVCVVRVS